MANILGLITINDKQILEVDADPSAAAGTPAPLGSSAKLFIGAVGYEYIKTGVADTEWERVLTAGNSGIAVGDYLKLPIYNTDATGNTLDDSVLQNGFAVDVKIAAQPARSVAIEYTIPNPGNAVAAADFVLTEGAQTIAGVKTFSDDAIFNANLTVNGTLTFLNSTNTDITDKLITLNKGGAAASAGGSGLEFEENAVITGYLKQAAGRDGFVVKPSNAFELDWSFSGLTANRQQLLADTDGTFVMRPTGTPFVAKQIAYGQDANNLVSEAGFEYDPTTNQLLVANARISGLGVGVVHADASGVLSSSLVLLGSEVSGVLPIANGGTNSSAALNNNRLMYSQGGAIVEYAALTPNKLYFGAATTGLPAQDTNLHWDIVNSRLGIGNAAPSRTLDVTGDVLVDGLFKIADTAKANIEWRQAEVQTTDATLTTLQTVAIPTDSEVLLEVRVMGRRASNGDSAAYVRTARFKNVGGTVTRHNLQTDYTSEDVGAWNATLVASGTNALVQVTGAAASTIDWTSTAIVQILQ